MTCSGWAWALRQRHKVLFGKAYCVYGSQYSSVWHLQRYKKYKFKYVPLPPNWKTKLFLPLSDSVACCLSYPHKFFIAWPLSLSLTVQLSQRSGNVDYQTLSLPTCTNLKVHMVVLHARWGSRKIHSYGLWNNYSALLYITKWTFVQSPPPTSNSKTLVLPLLVKCLL